MSVTNPIVLLSVLGIATAVSLGAVVAMICMVRSVSREQQRLHTEMFGLLRRIEGLTSHRREQVLHQFDRLIENLSARIPTLVAAKASERIFETESNILQRLAELEPGLSNDDQKEKLDSLIKSMETLEKTVVAHTATAVHQVMLENRQALFHEEDAVPIKLAQ